MRGYELNLENISKGLKNPSRVFDEILLDYAYRAPAIALNGYRTIGTNVFDKDWDLLVVLDTARVDALREIQDEYDFIDDVDSIRSVGGASAEWLARTFDEAHRDEIRETAFLTAQNHVQLMLDSKSQANNSLDIFDRALHRIPSVDIEDIGKVEYLFKYETIGEEGPFGHREGNTPPRYVTDRGISVSREHDFDRLMLQYHQPHTPWFSQALEAGRELEYHEYDWWNYYYETGDVETIWDAYMSDLRFVLDDIELLLENVDAENVAITADHGEAFGEYGVLGHTVGSLHPQVRNVPWITTSATDEETRTPTVEEPDDSKIPRDELNEQLEAMGYRV